MTLEVMRLSGSDMEAGCAAIAARIAAAFSYSVCVYGVPRGGVPVAYEVVRQLAMLRPRRDPRTSDSHCPVEGDRVTFDLNAASVVVDDVYDSGATVARIRKAAPFAQVMVLANKASAHEAEAAGVVFAACQLDNRAKWVLLPWSTGVEDMCDVPRRLLQYIGEDVEREGLRDTPRRYLHAWNDLTAGYRSNPTEVLGVAFTEGTDDLVVVRDIPFVSVCEHHLLPFEGRATVGYLPRDKVVGLSKIARLVDGFARRLQVQERLTRQIAEALHTALRPEGVGVLVEARHLCMVARGIQKDANMSTSCLLGVMRTVPELRAEFMALRR